MQTLCAMLNQHGGQVLFGVTPDGRMAGQQVGDRTLEEVSAEIREIDPPAFPTIERIPVDGGRAVIVVRVSASPARPYQYRGTTYRRVGNTTRAMQPDPSCPHSPRSMDGEDNMRFRSPASRSSMPHVAWLLYCGSRQSSGRLDREEAAHPACRAQDMEEEIAMKMNLRIGSRSGPAPRRAAVAVAALAMFASAGPAGAEDGSIAFDGTGMYAGAFAGSGRSDNRLVDVDGFANWGNPGSETDYDHGGFAGGVLVGRKFEVDRTRLRVELDATFGNLTARSDQLDPEGRDELVETDVRWVVTARVGVEEAVGRATVFATGGLAAARIVNSVTDTDFSPDMPPRLDPDDSFRDSSTELGWVIGAGVETPLADAWTLRLDGSYVDFGRHTHLVNRSRGNSCGSGGPKRACPYHIENRLGIVRLAIIRRFGL